MAKTPSKPAFTLLLTTILLFAMSKTVFSQNCGCSSDLCCSKWGYCGNTEEYCGEGCREGPCRTSSGSSSVSDGSVSLEGTVTPQFFDGIKIKRANCPGSSFYTHDAFLNAARSYPQFGSSISKREIAAFFAHVMHETGSLCYTEENDRSNSYCNGDDPEFPCAPGKAYYGRGPIQLTGNYNYGVCGRALNLNLLNKPEIVAQDPVVSFKTAFWFWTTNVRPVFNKGFGATIRAINGIECDGQKPDLVASRVEFYKQLCGKLGVDPGGNLYC